MKIIRKCNIFEYILKKINLYDMKSKKVFSSLSRVFGPEQKVWRYNRYCQDNHTLKLIESE